MKYENIYLRVTFALYTYFRNHSYLFHPVQLNSEINKKNNKNILKVYK